MRSPKKPEGYDDLPQVTMFPESVMNEADAGADENQREASEGVTKDRDG